MTRHSHRLLFSSQRKGVFFRRKGGQWKTWYFTKSFTPFLLPLFSSSAAAVNFQANPSIPPPMPPVSLGGHHHHPKRRQVWWSWAKSPPTLVAMHRQYNDHVVICTCVLAFRARESRHVFFIAHVYFYFYLLFFIFCQKQKWKTRGSVSPINSKIL